MLKDVNIKIKYIRIRHQLEVTDKMAQKCRYIIGHKCLNIFGTTISDMCKH